jgi:hypothetical protein
MDSLECHEDIASSLGLGRGDVDKLVLYGRRSLCSLCEVR